MANFKQKVCKITGHEWRQYTSLQKCPCDFCVSERNAKAKPKVNKPFKAKIASVSKKQGARLKHYSVDRKEFLKQPENEFCFVDGCGKKATTIEHQKGRDGYADKFARDNDIWLLNDIRFWKPCCLQHNLEFENNPLLSKQYQLSKLHDGKKI